MTQRERSRKARDKWQRLVSEQGRSGQSVAAFCRERGLCAPHFFEWKKRLGTSPWAKFVEVKLASGGPEPAGAAGEPRTGGLPRPGSDRRVEVVLKNGRSLRVGPGFDAELVRALLAVVEGGA